MQGGGLPILRNFLNEQGSSIVIIHQPKDRTRSWSTIGVMPFGGGSDSPSGRSGPPIKGSAPPSEGSGPPNGRSGQPRNQGD